MVLQKTTGAILVERVNHFISNGYGTEEERRNCAQNTVRYLCNIGCVSTPHWDKLLSTGGFEVLPVICPCQSPILQRVIAHEYSEAITLLGTKDVEVTTHCRNLETIAEILILSRNFKELEEIEYQVSGINSSRQDSLIAQEAAALRRIKLLLCASLYLRGRYFDCCSSFFKLLTSDDKMISYLGQEFPEKFLTNSELLMMVHISTLLAIPMDNYEDFIQLEELLSFQDICPSLYQNLKLLINTSFAKFFEIWHNDIAEQCIQSFFLDQNWPSSQRTMREKIYFFYLRVSHQIEISYLSRILGIEELLVRKEMEDLINSIHLSFEIKDDTVRYRHASFLEDVVNQLQLNEKLISSKLNSQRSKNMEMRDILQKMIIDNNQTNESVAGDTLSKSDAKEPRIEDSEIMDVDEINDVSDADNQSVEISN